MSEPLGDVAGVWNEVPESTQVHVSSDHAELLPFQPKAPASRASRRVRRRVAINDALGVSGRPKRGENVPARVNGHA